MSAFVASFGRGEACIYTVDESIHAVFEQRWLPQGIDVTSNALVLITKEQTYRKHGTLDPDWITSRREPTESAMREGFSGPRTTGRRARAIGVGLLSGGYGQDELEQAGAYRVY